MTSTDLHAEHSLSEHTHGPNCGDQTVQDGVQPRGDTR
jgi:hypothetical protein